MFKKIVVFAFIVCLIAFVYAEGFSMQATLTVNPPPIGLDANVTVLTKGVEQGEDLLFLVELSKQALNEITVDLKYEIIKKKGRREEIIVSETDSMQLVDYNSMQKSIAIPADFKPGKYELKVTATYFNQSDVDRDGFFAKKAKPAKPKGFFEAIFLFFNWLF